MLKQVLDDCDVDYDVSNSDMNGDGEITITDLSQLKMLVENTPNHTIYPDLVIDSENTDSNQECKKENSNVNTTTDTIGQETSKTDSLENNTSTTENKTNSNNVTSTNENETTETQHSSNERNSSVDETINKADNVNTVLTNNKNIYYERDQLDYVIRIGTVEVSDIQVRNAISKAVRDAIYGNMGIMTTLNNGKKLKIKTGF